jgi:hypothetical protein
MTPSQKLTSFSVLQVIIQYGQDHGQVVTGNSTIPNSCLNIKFDCASYHDYYIQTTTNIVGTVTAYCIKYLQFKFKLDALAVCLVIVYL